MNIEKIVREYIEKTFHMSLATVQNNKPWVCELHFAYDKNLNLYYRSLKSRRHSKEIADNSKVAGSIIDKYSLNDPVVGVYFEGTARLLETGKEQDLAAKCLKNRLKIENDILAEAKNEDGHQFYKINISNWYIYGSFNGNKGKKYQLKWNSL